MLRRFALSLVFMSAFCLPLFAQDCCHESLINTEATVNREIMPDTAKIRFSVENSGLNLANLKEKNDKIVSSAITAIKAQLNKDESIKTIAFNVRNVYSYKDKVRVFQKYVVTNGFEVKLKDLDKVSKIINLAMENDVKSVSGVNFLVENSEHICNEMMGDAVKIAKNRIQYLTQQAGAQLDRVKTINPYCSLSSSHVQPRMNKVYMANATMDSASGSQVEMETIEPGTINARASVNMTYYLK